MKKNMKKLITFLMLVAPLAVFSQTRVPADTVARIVKPKTVVISKKDGTTTVSVSGTEKDPDYKYRYEVQNGEAVDHRDDDEWKINPPFLKDGRRRPTYISGGEDVYINMMWPDAKSSGMKTSWEVGVGRLISFNWMPNPSSNMKLTFGIGLATRVISFEHDRRLYFNRGHLSLGKPMKNEKVKASKIVEDELRLPFMFTMPIYKDFKASFGVVGLLNFYSEASCTVERDGSKFSEKYKGLHQRILNYELVGTLGFDDAAGITFHYRPLSDFGSAYGPEFKTISVGLTLNF